MSPRLPLVLGGSLSLMACASQAPYAKPAVALAPGYRNASLPGAPGLKVQVGEHWWRAFGDPVLDRLVSSATDGSLSIEAARGRLQQAAAASRAARAALLPSGTVSGTAAVQRQSLEEPVTRFASSFPGFDRTIELYGLNAAASWEVDLFGRLSAGRRAALADEAAAAADVAGAQLTVTAEIVGAYIGARELQHRVGIARGRVRTLSELDRVVRLRFAEGVASRLEVDQAQADLAAVRATVPALEASLEATYNRIDVLAGRAPGIAAAELGAARVPAAVGVDVQEGPASLLRRRPDVFAAERRVAAADARAGQAVADYYPRVTISGLVGLLSTGLSSLFTGDALQTAGTAGFSGRLFDFGSARARVESARGRTREAIADYRATVLRAAAEVEDGLSLVARRGQQARELEASEVALTRARDTSRTAYEGGAVSLIEALDAERRLLAVQDEVITTRAGAAQATVALFRALGGGWDTAQLAVNSGAKALPRAVASSQSSIGSPE